VRHRRERCRLILFGVCFRTRETNTFQGKRARSCTRADHGFAPGSHRPQYVALHAGKHLPKATSSRGDPLIRIFRRTRAHGRFRSPARNPSHVATSASTRKSALSWSPSRTVMALSRKAPSLFRRDGIESCKGYVECRGGFLRPVLSPR